MKNCIFIFLFFLVPLLSIAQEKGVKEKDTDEDGDAPQGTLCSGGTERWSVKILDDAAASTINFTPQTTSVDALIHLATVTPGSNDARTYPPEFLTYTVNATIKALRTESDNDFHLVLQDPTHTTETMIGEVPDPTCTPASTSPYVNKFIEARNWVSTNIGTSTNTNLNIAGVCITGVGFYDPPHGQSGAAPNNLEIHSILNMIFCNLVGIETPEGPRFTADVSPTAFTESTNFHFVANKMSFGDCNLQLYDLKSNKVQDIKLPVSNGKEISYTFHRGNLAAGVYIYRIWNDATILYEGKLVIQ